MKVFFLVHGRMIRSAEQTNNPRSISRFMRFVCPALQFVALWTQKKTLSSLLVLISVPSLKCMGFSVLKLYISQVVGFPTYQHQQKEGGKTSWKLQQAIFTCWISSSLFCSMSTVAWWECSFSSKIFLRSAISDRCCSNSLLISAIAASVSAACVWSVSPSPLSSDPLLASSTADASLMLASSLWQSSSLRVSMSSLCCEWKASSHATFIFSSISFCSFTALLHVSVFCSSKGNICLRIECLILSVYWSINVRWRVTNCVNLRSVAEQVYTYTLRRFTHNLLPVIWRL